MSQMGAVRIREVARVAVGALSVLAQIALAFFFVGWAVLVIPTPSIFVLAGIWIVGIVIVIWLAIRDAWLAPLIPVAWSIVSMLMFEYGKANLGWGA
jgi:hypothetical protein